MTTEMRTKDTTRKMPYSKLATLKNIAIAYSNITAEFIKNVTVGRVAK